MAERLFIASNGEKHCACIAKKSSLCSNQSSVLREKVLACALDRQNDSTSANEFFRLIFSEGVYLERRRWVLRIRDAIDLLLFEILVCAGTDNEQTWLKKHW